jgi:HemY protein
MRRAILILVVLAAGVALALWLADVGGSVEVRVGDTWIGVGMPIALLVLTLGFLLLHGVLSFFGAMRRVPGRVRVRRAERRRTEGDAAVTRALVALGAGTAEAARLEVRKARAALGDTPQVLLLTAEAERLSGREDAAADAFRALAERGDSRFLGLRGLLRQAMARGDWDAALALAREAEAAQPGAAWVREAPRAGLALAAAEQEPEPNRAAELEREAFQADPAFAPAALAHARRLREGGSPRRARAVLQQAWASSPHPDLSGPYLEDEPDPLMRVKAVEALVRRNPDHPESRLLLARTALDAGLTGRARGVLEALVQSGRADRRAYLLLSELEEAEKGDTPDARSAQAHWLRDAAGAAPEPRWRCGHCGTDHAAWAPLCSACGTVGQISWTAAPRATMPMPAADAA